MPFKAQQPILIIGDVAVDSYWNCDTNRISPEAPVPVSKVTEEYYRPGCGANVALNIASLDGNPMLLSCVGDDKHADLLRDLLSQQQVKFEFEVVKDKPTINKLRILSRNQQLIRADFEEPFYDNDKTELRKYAEQYVNECSAMILSDYGKGVLSDPQYFIKLAKKAGVPVLVDPKGGDYSIYKGATLITPNFKEFTEVVGPCSDEAEIISKAQQLIKQCDLGALLITRGAKGMTLVQTKQEPVTIATQAREVFDVTGAGDTVIAVAAIGLASGYDFVTSMKLANLAGGIVVGKFGTATLTRPELEAALDGSSSQSKGITSKESLINMVRTAQAAGETVVMTNGCFDFIHAGHVDYLHAAKALGNKLIIAINTDDSITRLKGPTRPINNLENRSKVLSALEMVDWVISFDEDTPQSLIEAVMPDVLVKGADYQIHEIAGADAVLANGGEVKTIELTPGCSTTNIIKKIKEG